MKVSRRLILNFIIIIVNIGLQSLVLNYITVFGIKPNTAIILIVSISMLRGSEEGALFGFFTGLLRDIYFSNNVIGVNALLCALLGYYCAKAFKDYYEDSFVIPLLLVLFSYTIYEALYYFMLYLFKGMVDIGFYLIYIILPGLIYTLLLTIPIYKIIYIINERLEFKERGRRKTY